MAAANDSRLRASTPISEQDDESLAQYATATPTAANSSSNGAQSTSPRAPNHGSDADAAEKSKRKRQPRNSACQSCAALKMKCIATSVPGICERCSRMNRECLPAIPKPRKRRATDGFESKGIPLSDLLEHDKDMQESYRPARRPFIPEQSNGSSPQHAIHQSPHADYSRSFQRSFAHGLALDEKAGGYLLQDVDLNFARHCCDQFRYISASFPFIEAPYVDAASMVMTRPLTLVAICTVASGSLPDIRSRLSEAFRHALATRCVLEGEQSLDLMVGLLIYLAWHHQYYRKPQIYQNLCLLAGMATDLGIQNTPTLAEQARGVPEPEVQRAFIGVYYLVSSLSTMGSNKPSPLAWSSSLDHFASALYSSTGREVNLQPYVDLGHILEDHAGHLAAAPVSNASSYVNLATKSSLQRLQAIKRMHHPASINTAFTAVSIHINARAISSLSSGPPTTVVMQTAVSLKDYFDDILSRPPLILHHLPINEWINLIVALLLVTRLSAPAFHSSVSRIAGFSAGWESSSLASMLSPDTILDRICNHMAAAPNDQRQGPPQEGLLSWLRSICDGMRRRITVERADPTDSSFDAFSNLHRDRTASNVGAAGYGHDDGRFRAVNAPEAKPHLPAGLASPWSPTAATDLGFGLYGGIALLDDSFWVAFNNGNAR